MTENPHGKYGWGSGPKPEPKGVIAKLINWAVKKGQAKPR